MTLEESSGLSVADKLRLEYEEYAKNPHPMLQSCLDSALNHVDEFLNSPERIERYNTHIDWLASKEHDVYVDHFLNSTKIFPEDVNTFKNMKFRVMISEDPEVASIRTDGQGCWYIQANPDCMNMMEDFEVEQVFIHEVKHGLLKNSKRDLRENTYIDPKTMCDFYDDCPKSNERIMRHIEEKGCDTLADNVRHQYPYAYVLHGTERVMREYIIKDSLQGICTNCHTDYQKVILDQEIRGCRYYEGDINPDIRAQFAIELMQKGQLKNVFYKHIDKVDSRTIATDSHPSMQERKTHSKRVVRDLEECPVVQKSICQQETSLQDDIINTNSATLGHEPNERVGVLGTWLKNTSMIVGKFFEDIVQNLLKGEWASHFLSNKSDITSSSRQKAPAITHEQTNG